MLVFVELTMPAGIDTKVSSIFCDRNLVLVKQKPSAPKFARAAPITTASPMAMVISARF